MDILKKNNLTYESFTPANTVIDRKNKTVYPETGNGSTFSELSQMAININSSMEYINPKNCFLTFSIEATRLEDETENETLSYLFGSVLNIIKNTVTFDKYGVELDRLEDLNLLNYHRLRALYSLETLDSTLSGLMGTNYDSNGDIDLAPVEFKTEDEETNSNKIDFSVPLRFISSVFNSDVYMPPHLSDGLRIVVDFEEFRTAFTTITDLGGDISTNYAVTNVKVLLDTYRLSKLTFDRIDNFSKLSGLKYSFNGWDMRKRNGKIGDDTKNLDVDVAVSKAVKCICVRTLIGYYDYDFDSLASVPVFSDEKSSWRVGPNIYPENPTDTIQGQYLRYLQCWGNLYKPLIDIKNFKGDVYTSSNVVNYGHYMNCINFERSGKYTGITINGDHPLSFSLESEGDDEYLSFFVEYVKELNIKNDRTEVYK
jgi:hypothetical protein